MKRPRRHFWRGRARVTDGIAAKLDAVRAKTGQHRAREKVKSVSRGIVGGLTTIIFWELSARAPQLFGFSVPWIGAIPAPSKVFAEWALLAQDPAYWQSWLQSMFRVFSGFLAAFIIGVPLGLGFARRKIFRGLWFPVFEILRPIPPIAWVPIAIIFWPTQEMSIAFVIFLGAFYTMTLTTMNGAREIDPAVVQSASSMGANSWSLFRQIIWPATLPSVTTGAALAMGITWEVVVAAEMISGSQGGAAAGGGLGRLMWHSYITGDYTGIVVAMLSIGIAGYLSSAAIRYVGHLLTPWRVR